MFDQLKRYFVIVSKYRSTTDPTIKDAVLSLALPKLHKETTSVRPRSAIESFITENTSKKRIA